MSKLPTQKGHTQRHIPAWVWWLEKNKVESTGPQCDRFQGRAKIEYYIDVKIWDQSSLKQKLLLVLCCSSQKIITNSILRNAVYVKVPTACLGANGLRFKQPLSTQNRFPVESCQQCEWQNWDSTKDRAEPEACKGTKKTPTTPNILKNNNK